MRLLVVTPQLSVGGAERHIVDLASELQRNGHELLVSSHGGELVEPLVKCGIEHRCLPIHSRSMGAITSIFQLRRLVNEFQPDVVHAHSALATLMCRAAVAGRGVPVVVTGHGWPEQRLGMVAAALRTADAVIAISERMRTALISSGVAAHRVVVVRHGVSPKPFASTAAESFRRECGCAGETVLIGVVGRLIRSKGHTTMIEAAKSLPADLPWQMVFVGDGPLRSELQRQIASADLSNRIRLTGNQSDMGPVYGALDVAALPSYSEGMPLAVLEALASGVPVLATPVGGIPEIVEHNRTGWLVPVADSGLFADRLRQLIAKPGLRRAAGEAARTFAAAEFSSSAMVDKITRVYGSLIVASSLS